MASVSMPVLIPGLRTPGRRNSPEFEQAMSQAHGEIASWMHKYPAPEGQEAHWYIALFRPAGQMRVQASYDFDATQLRLEAEFTAKYAEQAEVLYACEHLADMKLIAGGQNILSGKSAAKKR